MAFVARFGFLAGKGAFIGLLGFPLLAVFLLALVFMVFAL
jgi:hypothetical protein